MDSIEAEINNTDISENESIAARFSYLDKEFVVHGKRNKKWGLKKLQIKDSQGKLNGVIDVNEYGVGTAKALSPFYSLNTSKANTGEHVRSLIRNAIAEIVIQSPEEITWHSGIILNRKSTRMYESLLNEINTEGTRFNSLLIGYKWKSKVDGEDTVRYSIRRSNTAIPR